MTRKDPLRVLSANSTENDTREEPWKDDGPVILDSIPLTDIDDADKTFQFRMPRVRRRLRASLKNRGQIKTAACRRSKRLVGPTYG